MKKILTLLIALAFVLPSTASAAYFTVPWAATSTTQGWIFPLRINGVEQAAFATFFGATSTTATSTFAGGFAVQGSKLIVQTGTGFVGVGTTSPRNTLDVYASNSNTTITSSGVPTLSITNSDPTNNNFSSLSGALINTSGSEINSSRISFINEDHTAGAENGEISLMTRLNGTMGEVMRWTNDKNVGIGTSTPVYKLDVYSNTGSSATNNWVARFDNPSLNVNANGIWASLGSGNNSSYILKLQGVSVGDADLVFTGGGILGVGTTSPVSTRKMTVANSTGVADILLDIKSTSQRSELILSEGSVAQGTVQWRGSTNGTSPGTMRVGTQTTSDLRFITGGSEFMTLKPVTGFLGVGTTTPVATVDSYSTASTTNMLLESVSGTGGCLTLKDVGAGGATYTQVYSKAGVLYSKVATSITTCN